MVPLFKKEIEVPPVTLDHSVQLLSVVCKVRERITKDNIAKHLNKCDIIKSCQDGFA